VAAVTTVLVVLFEDCIFQEFLFFSCSSSSYFIEESYHATVQVSSRCCTY